MTRKVKLNTDRKPLSGLYPVVLQLIIERKRALIYTGAKVHLEEFDDKKGRVRFVKGISRSSKETAEHNRLIRRAQEEVDALIEHYAHKGINFTAQDVAKRYRLQKSQDTLYDLFEKVICDRYACGKIGGAKAYESTYSKIRSVTQESDIHISRLCPSHIQDIYKKMKHSCASSNTVSFYMRNLRAVLNNHRPSTQGEDRLSHKLFGGIVLRREKTTKRALSCADMNALIGFEPKDAPQMVIARDLFLLCFLLRGVALADIFFMKRECFHSGYIRYRRHKTSVPLSVAVTSESSPLIEHYLSSDPQSPYLFCFLDGFYEPTTAYRAYRTALKRENTALKIIGKKLGLSIPLTSYCARHTWATQAKTAGISLEHISEAMGHTSQKTTAIYLKSFNQDILDGANSKVIAPYERAIRHLYPTFRK